MVKVSTDDVDWLAPGVDHRAWASALVARGPRVVLLTAGGGGVAVVTPHGITEVAVPPIDVVDTVGAGDAFGGGFLLSWLERDLGRPTWTIAAPWSRAWNGRSASRRSPADVPAPSPRPEPSWTPQAADRHPTPRAWGEPRCGYLTSMPRRITRASSARSMSPGRATP